MLALSPVLGLAALAGTAMVGARPVAFTVTGLAVFASVFFLGLLLCVPRPRVVWGRWLRALIVLGVEAAVVWQVSAATLRPPPAPSAPAPVAGQREWRLPTGSELAYVRVSPKRVTRPEPVVFLHGGPGVGDLAGDSAFYGRLAADGFQVYVYDQLGAGRSARLADPRGYGLARDVADLEAIRLAVHAERLNLVARGHGAQLAAAYLADHPDRVARAVLSAPAGLSPARPSAAALLTGSGGMPDPRTLAVSTLLQVEPATAHAFAGEAELSTHLALLRRRTPSPCPPSVPPRSGGKGAATTGSVPARPGAEAVPGGYGGYVALAGRSAPAALRRELAGVSVPVLIVKGACDAQSWSEAADYRRALPNARFTYAGDATAQFKALRAFLADRPVDGYEGAGPPPGYRGPA